MRPTTNAHFHRGNQRVNHLIIFHTFFIYIFHKFESRLNTSLSFYPKITSFNSVKHILRA